MGNRLQEGSRLLQERNSQTSKVHKLPTVKHHSIYCPFKKPIDAGSKPEQLEGGGLYTHVFILEYMNMHTPSLVSFCVDASFAVCKQVHYPA